MRALHHIEALIAAQRIDEAVVLWRVTAGATNQDWRFWFELGRQGLRLGQAEALACLRSAADATDDPAPLVLLAQQLLLDGDKVGALGAARTGSSRTPLDFVTLSQLGTVLSLCDAGEEALPLFQRAAKLAPADPAILFNLATAQRSNGLLEAAEKTIDEVLRLRPDNADACYFRAGLRTQTVAHNHIDGIADAIRRRAGRRGSGGAELHFAMGKELEDLGRYEEAFRNFEQGSRLRRQMFRYDVQSDLETMRALIAQHDAIAVATQSVARQVSEAIPIFIVGLPRSGTTLVERILAAHPDVTAGGELDAFPRAAVTCVGHGVAKAQFVGRSLSVPPETLRRTYFDLVGSRRGETACFTDKLPYNSLYVGLICRAIPDAKIIVLKRDPVANGFAIYSTLFGDAYPYSYALDELAAYMVGWHNLIAHWQRVFPDRIHTLRYEELVSAPETQIRKLVDVCDLPWNANCLDLNHTAGSVSSASAVQVRQPIHTRSVDKWRSYGRLLEPFAESLGHLRN